MGHVVHVDQRACEIILIVVEVVNKPLSFSAFGFRVYACCADEFSVVVDSDPLCYGSVVCNAVDVP